MSGESTRPEVSVIICTHNPREDYLRRTLEALRKQTLAVERWELLLIDNASARPLKAAEVKSEKVEKWESGKVETWEGVKVDLGWHPRARVVREDEVGLTAARLRAFREAKSELLVFVDDDNALFADYLESGLEIASQWPCLGAWGCQYFSEYDNGKNYSREQDVWSSRLETDLWTSLPDRRAAPFGGGMFLRKAVADEYQRKCATEPLRKLLDRAGSSLSSYGDFDIAFTACDIGLGIGRFHKLRLIHLIPAVRLTPEYSWRITRDSGYSDVIFRYLRGEKPPRRLLKRNLSLLYSMARELSKGKSVRLQIADELGRRKAIKFLRSSGV